MKKLFLSIIFLSFSIIYLTGQTTTTIAEIQGTGGFSSLNNDFIRLNGVVVTAVGDGFFFVQSSTPDNNDMTSEGIIVFSQNDITVSPNDVVDILGTVREFDNNTTIAAEQISATGSTDNTILPVLLSNDFPGSERQDLDPFERIEGQLVQFTNLSIVGPSLNSDIAYASASDMRPMREPGLEFPGLSNLPVWDGNPEIFDFVVTGLGLSPNPFLNANMKVTGTGVIVEGDFNYAVFPITYTISEENELPEVTLPASNEFNVGCLNSLFLDDEEGDYERRLEKITQYIVDQLGTPDIIALQEVTGEVEFEDLATSLSQATGLSYSVVTDQPNDFINNGYLVQNTFTVENIEALGTNLAFEGGSLHDRPPLLIEGEINTTDGAFSLSILNLHIRSLNGIETDFVQQKRNAQARSIANMVKDLQEEDKEFLVVGDFNAFQFSDGYVDVLSQIMGTGTLGALFPPLNIGIDPPLTNISTTMIPESEQYSFVFRGSAQILDHCLASEMDDLEISHFHYGRGNCDYPSSLLSTDESFRASDHDGFAVYLDTKSEVIEGDGTLSAPQAEVLITNPFDSADGRILFNLDQRQNIEVEIYNVLGQLIYRDQFGGIEEDVLSLPSDVIRNLSDWIYIFHISGSTFSHTEKVLVSP